MDLAFSHSFPCGTTALATRTIPLGEFWMTGGTARPIDSETGILGALRRIESDHRDLLESPAMISLPIIRACLMAGAADRITCSAPQTAPRKRRRQPRWTGLRLRQRHR
jgi:hypothetical protein